MIATTIASTVLIAIKARLYAIVFLVITQASLVVNRYSKFLNPIQSAKYWPFIILFVSAWKSVGYNCIIYLATLMGFDRSYYESAQIDGATKLQQIRYITLPMLKPTVIMLTLMAIGRIFYSDFGLFYQVPPGRKSNRFSKPRRWKSERK
mgnify:CR=1 FL=1